MKGNQHIRLARRAILMSVASLAMAEAAIAQEISAATAAQPGNIGATEDEIIVTARKRAETLIEVPVTITAVGAAELAARAINNVDAIARIVPGMISGEGSGTVQGGIIAIRGLAGADNNPLNDQAVSFNIDGVGIGRATVRRLSDFDIQQIEVLKGPQALFFGKNSPAGIISIRTADPTDQFEAKVQAGYEFKAREIRTEAYVSGPLTESLGFRVAGSFSDMQGWVKSIVPRDFPAEFNDNIFPPKHSRAPNKTDWGARGTLRFDDGDRFDARLKFSYNKLSGDSSASNTQFVDCPLGFPQSSVGLPAGLPIDNCKADDRVSNGDLNPASSAFFPSSYPRDGHTYLKQWQALGSLELNYRLSEALTLTSVTGWYKMSLDNFANFTTNYYEDGQSPRRFLASYNLLDLRETSEELRLSSDFNGPFNFMVGGLYQDTHGENGSKTLLNSSGVPSFIFVNNYLYVQDGKAWSVFGQGMLEIVPTIELSGGIRYSKEKKTLPGLFSALPLVGPTQPDVLVPITNPNLTRKVNFGDWSPEVTLSYKPTDDINIYGSYKRGFLSGGFASVAPTAGIVSGTSSITYEPQITKGFEAGFKAALFDRTLRFNIAAYNYKTTGLQVGVTVNATPELRNAGSVRTKGIEGDFTYRTPIDGFTLNGALAYNKGKYLDYQASCYPGQSSLTCFTQVNRFTGLSGLFQDLSGQPLVRAPKWTGNAGFNYETPISSGLKLGVLGSMNFTSKYFTDTVNTPGGLQGGYTLFDATVRVGDTDDRWEAAVIGRNLTNKYYIVRSSSTPFSGAGRGLVPQGGLQGDTGGYVSRGREIMLRLSYKFSR